MNKVMLIGNLGRDPEMSYTPNGLAVTKFSLAVRNYVRSQNNQSNERQDDTVWYNVTAFGKQAETTNTYLKKGSKVYVEGRINPRKYTDRNGAERISLDVTLNDMEFLTPKDGQGGGSSSGFGGDEGLGELDEHPF
jgi:single-strand DNA-binding protein